MPLFDNFANQVASLPVVSTFSTEASDNDKVPVMSGGNTGYLLVTNCRPRIHLSVPSILAAGPGQSVNARGVTMSGFTTNFTSILHSAIGDQRSGKNTSVDVSDTSVALSMVDNTAIATGAGGLTLPSTTPTPIRNASATPNPTRDDALPQYGTLAGYLVQNSDGTGMLMRGGWVHLIGYRT